jgi:RimJ/RimL family protein N-acetyltransferase
MTPNHDVRTARLDLHYIPNLAVPRPARGRYQIRHAGCDIGAVSLVGQSLSHGEIGYRIENAHTGQGFASEAVAAVVAAAIADHGFLVLSAFVRASNHASRRVLVKNGFQLVDPALARAQSHVGHLCVMLYRLPPPSSLSGFQ